MKRIIFSELFKNECECKLQIIEDQVRQVIANPDETETVKFDDLELIFFIKKLPHLESENFILVCSHLKDENLLVDLAFRILPELVDEIKTIQPIILLQELALKFGLTIRIGQQHNKFIFRESISLKSSQDLKKLIEIMNPYNHSFMQSIFIKINQKGNIKIANCALAYCIDSDKYMAWLMGKKGSKDIIIDIAPQIRGYVTPFDLIEAKGTFTFWISSSQLGEKEGYFFKVNTLDYYLEAGFTKISFYIIRNDQKLEMPIDPFRQGVFANCYAMWQPTELSILILDSSYDEAIASGANSIDEIEKSKKILITPPIIPPNSLITWARKEEIVSTTIYDSLPHFYQEVTSALQSISDKIATVNMYNAFWDITYKGAKIESRKPKRETDIHPIIHGLIFDIALTKNFEISPEYQIRGGRLDFLISGHLKTGETANVCVEFKHAHSPDLEDGLLKQLPEYMRAKGCNFGLYCVLFFKGSYFTEPNKFELNSIDLYLNGLANSAGLSNIRNLIFNFAHPKPPSKL